MIIFINGSINAGKSTVAKILKEKLGNCAVLEIDVLRQLIDWLPLEEAIPINLENAASIIKNLATQKISCIVPYPLSQKNYEFLAEKLKDQAGQLHFFTLSPKLEIASNNRGDRVLSDWEKDRVKYHYQTGIHRPTFGVIIDNSNQTPEETANYILTKIS